MIEKLTIYNYVRAGKAITMPECRQDYVYNLLWIELSLVGYISSQPVTTVIVSVTNQSSGVSFHGVMKKTVMFCEDYWYVMVLFVIEKSLSIRSPCCTDALFVIHPWIFLIINRYQIPRSFSGACLLSFFSLFHSSTSAHFSSHANPAVSRDLWRRMLWYFLLWQIDWPHMRVSSHIKSSCIGYE